MSATPVMPTPQVSPRAVDEQAWGPQPFREDIVGLRGIAIVLVVAFHAAIPYFRGGFIGVDVFLVLSGYLITSMLLGDVARYGKLRIGRFYARRAKRVLPPAAAVLAVVALTQALISGPLRAYNSLFDYLFALVGGSNWWFAANEGGYLDGALTKSPVLHYWSLSVEQQVYLVWPLLLLPAAAFVHRKPSNGIWVVRAVLATIFGVSLYAAIWTTNHDPDAAYFVTHTRVWQFAAGGFVAALLRVDLDRSQHLAVKILRVLVSWCGLAAIVGALLTITEETLYPGWIALAPTLGTAAILWSGGVQCVPGSVGALLSNTLLRGIGLISYSWYLWHWPALIFLEELTATPSMLLRCGAVLVSLGLAIVSYYVLEKPLATLTGLRNSWAAGGLAVGSVLASTVVVLSTGLVAVNTMTTGAPRQPTQSLASIADTPADDNLVAPDPDITLAPRTTFAGAVVPQVTNARGDYPDKRKCMLDDTAIRPSDCVFGPESGTPVVLVGDSHMHQWQGAIQEIAQEAGWRLHVFYLGGCPVAEVPASWATEDLDRFARPSCKTFRDETFAAIESLQPSIIFTSALNRYTTNSAAMEQAWEVSLERLDFASAKLVYIYDTPWPGQNVPACVARHLDDWDACRFTPDPGAEPLPQMIADGDLGDALAVNLNDQICPQETCPVVYEGVLMYRDESHLTNTFAKELAPILKQRLERGGILEKERRQLPNAGATPTTSATPLPGGSASPTPTGSGVGLESTGVEPLSEQKPASIGQGARSRGDAHTETPAVAVTPAP